MEVRGLLRRVSGGDGAEWGSAVPHDSQPVGRTKGARRSLWDDVGGDPVDSAYPQDCGLRSLERARSLPTHSC